MHGKFIKLFWKTLKTQIKGKKCNVPGSDTQFGKDVNSSQIDLWIKCNSIKIRGMFFMELDKLILKCIWKSKKQESTKKPLKTKTKVEGFALPDLKTYYKTAVINYHSMGLA